MPIFYEAVVPHSDRALLYRIVTLPVTVFFYSKVSEVKESRNLKIFGPPPDFVSKYKFKLYQ